MISFDNGLLELIEDSRVYYDVCFDENKHPLKTDEQKKAYDKTYTNARAEANKTFQLVKKHHPLRSKQIISILSKLVEEDFDYINIINNNRDINEYDFLFLREKMTHLYLSTLFNLQNVNAGRKIFRDMRDLLISIGEY